MRFLPSTQFLADSNRISGTRATALLSSLLALAPCFFLSCFDYKIWQSHGGGSPSSLIFRYFSTTSFSFYYYVEISFTMGPSRNAWSSRSFWRIPVHFKFNCIEFYALRWKYFWYIFAIITISFQVLHLGIHILLWSSLLLWSKFEKKKYVVIVRQVWCPVCSAYNRFSHSLSQ